MKTNNYTPNFTLTNFSALTIIKVLIWSVMVILVLNYIRLGASWDGAMNLLPAKNLALYGKYYSFYFDEYFPSPIQTRFTLQLPSALIYWLIGINKYTITLACALYVVLILFVSQVLYSQATDKKFNFLALLIPFTVPLFFDKALRGWGEFITCFYILIALFFYLKNEKKINFVLSGFFLGLAVITKTIGIIALPVFLILLIKDFLFSEKRKFFTFLLYFTVGLIACFLLYIVFQISIIGIDNWLAWFNKQYHSVLRQAGVSKLTSYVSNDPLKNAKWYSVIFKRAQITARNAGMNFAFFSIYILWGIVNGIAVVYDKTCNKKLKNIIIFGLIISLTYFIWWLYISPYNKMETLGKFRRIMPAFYFVGLNYVLYIYFWINKLKTSKFRNYFYLFFLFTVSVFFLFKVVDNKYLLNYTFNPLNLTIKENDQFLAELDAVVTDTTTVFGMGYRQAPQFALRIKGHFDNIFKYNFDEIKSIKQKYIFRDSYAINTNAFRAFLEVFDHEVVLEKKSTGSGKNVAELIKLKEIKKEFGSEIDTDTLKKCLNHDELSSYKNKYGFYRNNNWTIPYSVILLKSDTPCKNLDLKVFVPSGGKYFNETTNYRIYINNLEVNAGILQKGMNDIKFEIPISLQYESLYSIAFELDSYFISDRGQYGNKYYGAVLSSICLGCNE